MKFNNKLRPVPTVPNPQTFGKDKNEFLNEFFARYNTDTYGLSDEYQGQETHLGAGEDQVWNDYLEFLASTPKFQKLKYSDYFNHIDKQKK